jgi:hypothetical protein
MPASFRKLDAFVTRPDGKRVLFLTLRLVGTILYSFTFLYFHFDTQMLSVILLDLLPDRMAVMVESPKASGYQIL